MRRSRTPVVALLAAALVVWPTLLDAPAAGATGGADDEVGAAQIGTFEQSWTRNLGAGAISTASPVLVDGVDRPFVVTGDNRGRVRAVRLDDGADVPGWGSSGPGFGLRAPLSSDGTNVYVPVAQDGKDRYPQYRKYGPGGNGLWISNPGTSLGASGRFLLAGLSLGHVDGTWRGFGGSSGHWIYGVDTANGANRWQFRNADSTMATPAVADLFGTGRPQVITSNDTTAEFAGDRHGGILRILTADGEQICSATQLVNGSAYAASGYNNSSPVVTHVDGTPRIVFGSTGPVQSGNGGNQLVAYDAGCRLKWASPPLAAQVQASPSLADVLGTGSPQLLQVVGIPDGAHRYPRVYVIDPRNGAVLRDSGTSLRSYGAALAYPPSISITTADLTGDGRQELFVPARTNGFLVLDGPTLGVRATLPTNLVIQNTPIVTQEPGGVRITLAGYSGAGAIVSSYTHTGGSLGVRGWHTFGGNPQLTGSVEDFHGPYDQLLEGSSLVPGSSLVSPSGSTRLAMQSDGNLVLSRSGAVRWASSTYEPGSRTHLHPSGELRVVAPGGAVRWRSGSVGHGVERLVVTDDGVASVLSGSWAATRRLTSITPIWRSTTGPLHIHRIGHGHSLSAGQALRSRNGRHRLVMQTDGNLVLYNDGRPSWQSGSRDPSGRARALFSGDGNLAVIGGDGRVRYNATVEGRGGQQLAVRDTGPAVVLRRDGSEVWRNGAVVK